jgi:hypothetical protein
VKSLDNRRVYEIYPGAQLRSITDFEGRTIAPGPQPASLAVTGAAARVTLRWRFNGPAAVSVNDRKLNAVKAADGSVSVEFDHQGTSRCDGNKPNAGPLTHKVANYVEVDGGGLGVILASQWSADFRSPATHRGHHSAR